MTVTDGTPAILVGRRDSSGGANPAETRSLARVAGYKVLESMQTPGDFEAALGLDDGAVSRIERRIADSEVTAVIVDDRLTPHQRYALAERFPGGTAVIGRIRLLLDVLAARKDTREAQVSVERAECEYEITRLGARRDLARRDEPAPDSLPLDSARPGREDELEDRISRLRTTLDDRQAERRRRIERRRESGFHLVGLTGYVNAGRTTLLRRLGADVAVGEESERHPDLTAGLPVDEDPFTTIGPATRRMQGSDRDVLLTDTIGAITGAPGWLWDAFRPAVQPLREADAVVVVVEATDPPSTIRRKVETALGLAFDGGDSVPPIALTKIDLVDSEAIREKRAGLERAFDTTVVPLCAQEGTGIEELERVIHDALPALERRRIELPLSEEAMSLVSRIHDEASVVETEYGSETVVIEFQAADTIVDQLVAAAESVQE
ncbi:MAG: GTPase [Halodesulfurarchaeum sp.]